MKPSLLSIVLAAAVAGACGGDDVSDNPAADAGVEPDSGDGDGDSDGGDGDGDGVPETYEFDSRFGDGSSVSYSGQVLRQVLIADMRTYISGLSDRVAMGDAPEDVVADLNFYYQFDETGATAEIAMNPGMPLVQSTYGDIGSAKSLRGKIAGQDEMGQHKDWSMEFAGWGEVGATNPDALVQSWFQGIADQIALRTDALPVNDPVGPNGEPYESVYVSPEGLDYRQLLHKFLMVAVGFSQAADDYLDDADADHGLNVSNAQDGEALHSSLEHHWDEGFGYFGASRFYGQATDEEIADTGYVDADGSGDLDLLSEVDFALAVYAAERDLGSAESAKTDFSGEAMEAFLTGRAIIASAGDTLTDDEKTELLAARDQAIDAWEKTIAANTIHYINETLADMDAFGTENYSFESHAAHWSEMKGFGLGLQFNPRSPLSDEQFAELHTLMGIAPVLPNADEADVTAYRAALENARGILAEAYGFADANVMGW